MLLIQDFRQSKEKTFSTTGPYVIIIFTRKKIQTCYVIEAANFLTVMHQLNQTNYHPLPIHFHWT